MKNGMKFKIGDRIYINSVNRNIHHYEYNLIGTILDYKQSKWGVLYLINIDDDPGFKQYVVEEHLRLLPVLEKEQYEDWD